MGTPDLTVDGRARARLVVGVVAICGLIAGSTVLSVNLFPAITNDSLTYIGYGRDLGGFGFVHSGYRQFGYPLFLWLTESISTGVLSIEPLLFVSFVQRLLLLAALAYAIWLWRWWAFPVVVVALTAEILSYTNLLLTEGVSVSLALILVCATGHFITVANRKDSDLVRTTGLVVGVMVVLIALVLISIRFPFAVFGISPLVVAIAARNTVLRRDALVLFGLYLAGAALIVGLLTVENRVEYGELAPNTRSARSEYWAAWATTFKLDPLKASDPDLAEFFDGGTPYNFIDRVDALDVPYSEQAAIYEQAIEELIVATGSGVWGSRLQSFLGALQGGRLNDIDETIERIKASNRANVDEAIHSNFYARQNGPEAFADVYNHGQLPEAVITAPLAERFPLPTAYVLIRVLLPISLVACCYIAVVSRDARMLAVAGLTAVIAYSALIGYIRADNFRFLLTTSVFGIGAGMGALAMWHARRGHLTPTNATSDQT